MITIDLNQRRTKILLVILAVILVVVLGFTFYAINKRANVKNQKNVSPVTTVQPEKPVPLTQEQIQKALSQKVAPENQEKTEPLTTEEINKVLDQKLPESEVKPLSQAEIQQVLNAKAK